MRWYTTIVSLLLTVTIWNCAKRNKIKPVVTSNNRQTTPTRTDGDKNAPTNMSPDTGLKDHNDSKDTETAILDSGVMSTENEDEMSMQSEGEMPKTEKGGTPKQEDMTMTENANKGMEPKLILDKDLYLVNSHLSKCMSPSPITSSYVNGHLIKQIECFDLSIRWSFKSDGTLRHVASGLCLTPMDGKKENGTPLRLWACKNFPHQKWLREQRFDGGYHFKGETSGRCLTPSHAGKANDTPQRLWDCKDDFPHQAWRMEENLPEPYSDNEPIIETIGYFNHANGCVAPNPTGDTIKFSNGHLLGQKLCSEENLPLVIAKGDGTIRHIASGLCFTPKDGGTKDGTQVRLWECKDDFAHQFWRLFRNGDRNRIDNRKSEKCLISRKNEQNDYHLEITACNPIAEEQNWAFQRELFVKNSSSGKCMALEAPPASGRKESGMAVRQRACNDTDQTRTWVFRGDGTIRHAGTNRCLTPQGAATTNGTVLQLEPCLGLPHQIWSPRRQGHAFQIVHKRSRRCLTPQKDGQTDLTPQRLWDCSQVKHQIWTLE